MEIQAGFDYASRNYGCALSDADGVHDLGEDKWSGMSTIQRSRYLSAAADLNAVVYAKEEGLVVVGDPVGRIKQLKAKMESACQTN